MLKFHGPLAQYCAQTSLLSHTHTHTHTYTPMRTLRKRLQWRSRLVAIGWRGSESMHSGSKARIHWWKSLRVILFNTHHIILTAPPSTHKKSSPLRETSVRSWRCQQGCSPWAPLVLSSALSKSSFRGGEEQLTSRTQWFNVKITVGNRVCVLRW